MDRRKLSTSLYSAIFDIKDCLALSEQKWSAGMDKRRKDVVLFKVTH
jgi:hypothetical protein